MICKGICFDKLIFERFPWDSFHFTSGIVFILPHSINFLVLNMHVSNWENE